MQSEEITCRLVKIELPTGEKEILCTSLLDHKTFTHKDMEELYHSRWNEEEAYKLLKSRVEVENFSGKIYFETELEKGTTFYIEIPVYENEVIENDNKINIT